MRKLYLVLMVLGLLLAGFTVAQAANPFDVQGTITDIDTINRTLNVDYGVKIYTTAATVVVISTEPATFELLSVGLEVKIQTTSVDGEPVAGKICVPIKQIIE